MMNKNVVVLIPVYDPNESLMTEFLQKLTKEFSNIVFVDDGSNKKHKKFMNDISSKYPLIKHAVNLGKGRGLKNGINYILNNFDKDKVIVMADCDGQHSVEDIKRCADVALKYPDSLVLGVRDFDQKDVPFKSKYGNKITKNILNFFVGQKISDTQTGLRAMSCQLACRFIEVEGERYEYETNCLIVAHKLNIPIKEVVIKTIYINNNETSHFNPVKDSLRIYKLFSKYILLVLVAFILENIFLVKYLNHIVSFSSLVYYLVLGKLITCVIILLFNKTFHWLYYLGNLILDLLILYFVNTNVLLIKILIDVVYFGGYLFFYKFKTKKY